MIMFFGLDDINLYCPVSFQRVYSDLLEALELSPFSGVRNIGPCSWGRV